MVFLSLCTISHFLQNMGRIPRDDTILKDYSKMTLMVLCATHPNYLQSDFSNPCLPSRQLFLNLTNLKVHECPPPYP